MNFLLHGEVNSQTEKVILLFHGFPGILSKQNRDLAEALWSQLKIPTVIFFYPGLSVSPGKFSYTRAYQEIIDFINQILSLNSGMELKLFGHSFGGYLSLRLLKDFTKNINQIFLLSPLLFIMSEEFLSEFVAKVYAENPNLERYDIHFLKKDYQNFVQGYNPQELKKITYQKNIKLLQSKADIITPTPIAIEYVQNTEISYEESEQEHGFLTNRQEVINKALHFFKEV